MTDKESPDQTPTGEPQKVSSANWHWLEGRVAETTVLDQWLADQLEQLEQRFADYVTPGSLARSFRGGKDR